MSTTLSPTELRKAAGAKIHEAEEVQKSVDAEKRGLNAVEEQKILSLLAGAEELQNEAASIEGAPSRKPSWRLAGGSATHNLHSAATALDRLLPRLSAPAPTGRLVRADNVLPSGDWDLPRADPRAPRSGGNGKRLYCDMFPSAHADDRGGFADLEEFLRVVGMGLSDPRLQLGASMGGAVGSKGGFFVPQEFARFFLDSSLESEVIRPRAAVFPMESDTLRIAGFDGSNSATSIFGFDIQWLGESQTAARSTGKVRSLMLNARKMALYVAASSELIQDGFGFEQQLGTKMQEALSFGLDDAFINGNGAGQPLGLLAASSTITVSKESAQAANTIRYENLTKMFARLLPRSQRSAVWLVHPSTLPQLMALVVPVKNLAATENVGGGMLPVLQNANGRMTIFGLEVVITEKCQALSTAGDVILVDLSFYGIGMRQEIVLERSNAPGWLQDELDFRVKIRVDGAPLLNVAYTPRHGSDTLSWCVILESR